MHFAIFDLKTVTPKMFIYIKIIYLASTFQMRKRGECLNLFKTILETKKSREQKIYSEGYKQHKEHEINKITLTQKQK